MTERPRIVVERPPARSTVDPGRYVGKTIDVVEWDGDETLIRFTDCDELLIEHGDDGLVLLGPVESREPVPFINDDGTVNAEAARTLAACQVAERGVDGGPSVQVAHGVNFGDSGEPTPGLTLNVGKGGPSGAIVNAMLGFKRDAL